MATKSYIVIGTYTKGRSKGIYGCPFPKKKGVVEPELLARIKNPSYLVISHDRRFIYSVTENEDGPGYVNAFRIDKDAGKLTLLGRRQTKGEGPCYIEIDPTGKYVVTANYGDGSLSVFPINDDGSLAPLSQRLYFCGDGKDPERQEASHLHCVVFSPDGCYLFGSDLGADIIYRYRLAYGPGGELLDKLSKKDFTVRAGAGPRHMLFDDKGRNLYLINELSGTVLVMRYRDGDLEIIQRAPIDERKSSETGDAGDIAFTPDGKYLYASMREGNDGVALFAVDGRDGKLTKKAYYNTALHPRDLAVSPDGKYLMVAGMQDDKIEIWNIDSSSGELEPSGMEIALDMPTFTGFI